MTSNQPESDDHDYQAQYGDAEDDERTIEEEEEEQLSTDDEQSELSRLQNDANMPLDELLKMYSNNPSTINLNTSQEEDDGDEEESYSSSDIDDDDDEEEDVHQHDFLRNNGELLREHDDDDDTEDSLYEPEIIKFINVGEEYQAEIDMQPEYNSTNENSDKREVPIDELLWSSSSLNDSDNENIDEYLKTIHNEYPSSDDEISLQTLLNCQYDTELALVTFRQLPIKTIYSYPEWSLAEIQHFEEGLREYGKNFYKIFISKCPTRSVREVIHFYYQWKKSERYQLFLQEQERLNTLPSVSDIIEKFIEVQEHQLCSAAGVVDSTHSSSYLSNEFKLHTPLSSTSSISFVTIRQEETTTTTTMTKKRTFDQVEHEDELTSSAKKSITTKTTSSVEATATIV